MTTFWPLSGPGPKSGHAFAAKQESLGRKNKGGGAGRGFGCAAPHKKNTTYRVPLRPAQWFPGIQKKKPHNEVSNRY